MTSISDKKVSQNIDSLQLDRTVHHIGLISVIAFVWSLFQLYSGSGLPYALTSFLGVNLTFNIDEVRIIHLGFALILACLIYPFFPKKFGLLNATVLIIAIIPCTYLYVFREDIANRPGLPTEMDLIISTLGLISILIFAKRTLGLALVVVASVFMLYVFFGDQQIFPENIRWKGASYGKAMWHFWMQTEGVFGVALGVSASLIFLFVLFGALLDKAGAGNYFIKLSFSLLGRFRGGPAKAAVLSSALTGIISGSSIANTVTTGTFTIPLMKRTGFTPEKAGAIEVASSTNGQLTPPVMGAAAFLMVEYTGVTYLEVIKHAFLPALVSYCALMYIVHLEALKLNLKRISPTYQPLPWMQQLQIFLRNVLLVFILALIVYYGFNWLKGIFGEATLYVAIVLFLGIYILLLQVAAKYPDLEPDNPNEKILQLPEFKTTLMSGLYFILPIVILIWCLMIERFSPGLSVFWSTLALIFIILTQGVLKSYFRREARYRLEFKKALKQFYHGMIAGAQNMVGIAMATGVAGIVVGTVSLTGAHQVIGEFIEFLAGDNLMLILFFVAIFSLILGMGLPTTANYIVVSSLMAPVIINLGSSVGFVIPLIAVHMFVFGILADDTPPVGIAAYAAAGISKGNPIKTGIQGFMYDIRTAILPFLFIFNHDLLLIDVSWLEGISVFFFALIAMLLFASATQNYFLVKNKIWESAVLLLIAFALFRPGYFMDKVVPPYVDLPPKNIYEIVKSQPDDSDLRVVFKGIDTFTHLEVEKTMLLPLGEKLEDGAARLMKSSGLGLRFEDEGVFVDDIAFQSLAEKNRIDYDWELLRVLERNQQPAKQLFYLPALILLLIVILLQKKRANRLK